MGAGASAGGFDDLRPRDFRPVDTVVKTDTMQLAILQVDNICIEDKKFPQLPGATSWLCNSTHSSGGTWGVHVTTVPATNAGRTKVALLLHSFVGKNRCSALFAPYCPHLSEAGYDIIAIDFPGYGRSCDTLVPARSNIDEDLVVAILKAFGVEVADGGKEVTFIGAGGGCGTFARMYVKYPSLFGGHHVFHNPVLQEHPKLGETMLRKGCDIYALLSEGWDKDDYNFIIATCKQFFVGLFEGYPELVTMVPLRYEGSISALKGPKPGAYLTGTRINQPSISKEKSFYMFQPSEECVQDIIGYLRSKRHSPVEPAAIVAPPTKSALELGGAVNENFKVYVRVRPMLEREVQGKSEGCVRVEDVQNFSRTPPPQRIHVEDPSLARVSRGQYVFDRVFVEDATQAEVFDSVAAPLVHSCVHDKKNITIFAYGQTGTGKTYTMEGTNGIAGKDGLISRSIMLLFELLSAHAEGVHVAYQYVQLYGGEWLDLLSPASVTEMKVEEVKEGGDVLSTRIRGATTLKADSVEELLKNVEKGARFRASGATNMNDASSRSHAILIVMLSNNTTLYLIDLAGSERTKRSGASGQRMAEATSINLALSALGRVVINLVEQNGKRSGHVSYLDNPLTHVLMPGLGGRSKTALVSCITAASDSLSESVQTLRFSVQASHVKNTVNAKVAQDKVKKAEEKIANKGNALHLDEEGTGSIPVPCGSEEITKLFGFWSNHVEARTIIFIHDFQKNAKESFEPIVSCLKEMERDTKNAPLRVLAPTFFYESEKQNGDYHSQAIHKQLLAILDYLGVPKATIVGQDLGGINAMDFQLRHRTRAAAVVAQNKINDLDEKGWKMANKRDPSFAINCMQNVWCWVLPFEKDAQKRKENYFKKFRGPCTILWPHCWKGRPDPKGNSVTGYFVKNMTKNLKGIRITDSYKKSDEEIIKCIVGAASSGSGKKKGGGKKKNV